MGNGCCIHKYYGAGIKIKSESKTVNCHETIQRSPIFFQVKKQN
jgi:hypothetical protein